MPDHASRQLRHSLTCMEKSGWQQTPVAERPPTLSPMGTRRRWMVPRECSGERDGVSCNLLPAARTQRQQTEQGPTSLQISTRGRGWDLGSSLP